MSTTLAEEMRRVKELADLEGFCDQFLTRRGPKTYNCPLQDCGSGTGPNGTAAYHVLRGRWHCFSCNRGGDIFDLYGLLNNTEDKREQLEGVARWAGIATDLEDNGPKASPKANTNGNAGGVTTGKGTERPQKTPERHVDGEALARGLEHVRAAYRTAHSGTETDRAAFEDYLEGRGIDQETAERYYLGYENGRIVIPDIGEDGKPTGTHTRRIAADRYEGKDKFLGAAGLPKMLYKVNLARDDMGESHATAAGVLDHEAVFVVEGQFDAIAISEAGQAAVALGGAGSNHEALAEYLEGYEGHVILMLDPDKAGRDNTGKLLEVLTNRGIRALNMPMREDTEGHDPGEYLDRPEALGALLWERIRMAPLKELEVMYIRDAADIARAVTGGRHTLTPIPTGEKKLDTALGGGLMRKSLYALGGYTSMGKTTLMHQIADNIARRGRHVLYVSIEQRAVELVPKSLTRMIANGEGGEPLHVTCDQLTHTDKRREWEKMPGRADALERVGKVYEREIAPYMHYMDAQGQPTVRDIERVGRAIRDTYGEAPIVFIDYLQLIRPADEWTNEQEAIKRNMVALRQMAGEGLDTPVVVIVATSRHGAEDNMETSSMRDSSNIEYSADVLLGIQPRGMRRALRNTDEKHGGRKGKARAILAKTRDQDHKELEIVIMKNRYGRVMNGESGGVPTWLDGATSRFSEAGFSGEARPGTKRMS